MRLILLSLLYITIGFSNVRSIVSTSQFCTTLYKTTKLDKCPDPSSFNILEGYSKPSTEWTLNLPALFDGPDIDLHEEIKKRFRKGTACPYIRHTNKTICCEGWQGTACDQQDMTLAKPTFATCHLWDRDHIRTFDGTYYRFPGRCTYKLLGTTKWQINIEFINCTTRDNPCEKKLTIAIGGKVMKIDGEKLSNRTTYPSGLTIRRQAKNLLELSFTIGIRLIIDQNRRTILLQSEKNLLGDEVLSGLCGDNNDDPDDDLKLITTGETVYVPIVFGNQWKVDRSCPDVPIILNDCPITPAVIDQCIDFTNKSSLFQSCFRKVNPDYFYQACLEDVCSALLLNQSSMDVRCRTLEAYAEECQEHKVPIQWRSKSGCSQRCSARHTVYSDCIPSISRTCENPNPVNIEFYLQNVQCTSGCVCSNETVYDTSKDACVPLEKCTCEYDNKRYQPGDHVPMDCNDCQCEHGRWSCTNRTCPRTCLVIGEMNILTFDGKQYAVTSSCNQVLVETSDQSSYLRITYVREKNELSIQILHTTVVFRQNDILLNGNFRHGLPYQVDNVIIRRASTVFFEVRDTRSTVIIHYDRLTARIYVKLSPSFLNRVRGLCGTFNYKTHDDFQTPNNVIETNLIAFATAYLAAPCTIPEQQTDACMNFPENKHSASIECSDLFNHPIFSICSSALVDRSFLLTACVQDLCTDQSSKYRNQVKCSVLSALAHACALKGIVIDWMSDKTLARTCEGIVYGQCEKRSNAKYSECISECRSACTDIDLMPISCVDQCLPGCGCQSGQFYDEYTGVCQDQHNCSCYEPQSEQYIHPSQSRLIKNSILSNCSCSNASLHCKSFNKDQCSPSQIYSLNATLCPQTCANYFSHYECGLYGPGCTCPSGTVLLDSTSNCLPSDQCPCQYNQQLYREHDMIIQNNHGYQNCTCGKGGRWFCKKSASTKSCTTFGSSHYQTFDGLHYEFTSQCQYVLAKDSKNSFRILSQNVPCGMSGEICAKNILIEYNNVTIDLIRGRTILLNKIELSNYQKEAVSFGKIHIQQFGLYIIIKTDVFTLKWDEKTYVEITIKPDHQMSGLCGNNNDDSDDDLQSADGATQISIPDMTESWKTSIQCTSNIDQSIRRDPCAEGLNHVERRAWAEKKCSVLKGKSGAIGGPFDICIEKMDGNLIEKYYQSCIHEVCYSRRGSDCESVCALLTAFTTECQTLVRKPLVEWRTEGLCPIRCDSGKVYMACGPHCPQTCFQDANPNRCIADSACFDGCFCPNGQVMNEHGQCIESQRCPCLYNEKRYPQGSRIMMSKNSTCRQECECINGSFLCTKNAPTECTTETCTSNQFACKSADQCIPSKWQCDGFKDCLDGSDELKVNCQKQCQNHTKIFRCTNGQCIDKAHRCNGVPDCRDGSDEVNCSHMMSCKEYECPISKLCIPKAWICDGKVDCGKGDESDEGGDCKWMQCDTSCGRYFQCRSDQKCLPIEQRCDGHKDCNDGSDELHCPSCTCTSAFSCLQTCQCIDARRVCDGKFDCTDRTDELNCTSHCDKDEYTCFDGKCLKREFLCDGIRHCSKGEDETHPDCSASTTRHSTKRTTATPTHTTKLTCDIQSALIGGRFLAQPELSTPIHGSISDLNPDTKGIDFVVDTPSTAVSIILPLKENITISHLVKFQILRPSNVNRFRMTVLNKYRKPAWPYHILSTDSKHSGTSPTVDQLSIPVSRLRETRFVKIDILDTIDDQPPQQVTLLFDGCFERAKVPHIKTCTQIDAMDDRYATRIIAKLGGTRPFNSTYGHLLQGYGGVTYNTSEAVIDIRLHKNIISRINQISIPSYVLHRTNVKKIIVDLFDRNHRRLFRKKTTTMIVSIHPKKKLPVRFIRISILETKDKYAPFNVTVSVKGCFYRKHFTHKRTTKSHKTTKSSCYRANALHPDYAHRIIGQFEGTQPLPGFSFLNLLEPAGKGVDYASKSPIILVRFQSNVVGRLDEISMIHSKDNVKEFQIDLFDFNNDLIYSKQSTYPQRSIQIPSTLATSPLFSSSIQITILSTLHNRPARGIIPSISGCFSTISHWPTTTKPSTTVAPTTTTTVTTSRPRRCHRLELTNDSRVIAGVTSNSQLTHGNLSELGRYEDDGATFSDLHPSIDFVFHPNILIYLDSISIISPKTNLKQFRIELLNTRTDVQYKIQSSSMTVNLASLPAVVLAGIRLKFLQTTDDQPPRNIILSIQACAKTIVIPTHRTTTSRSTTKRSSPKTTPITPDPCPDIDAMEEQYSTKTLAGLSGTNPQGVNASLLDLTYGKSISFNETAGKVVIFVIFKPNLFAYLKSVGLTSLSDTNVEQIGIEYLDENQLLLRKTFIDYSKHHTTTEPIQGVGAIKFTIKKQLTVNQREMSVFPFADVSLSNHNQPPPFDRKPP